MSTAPHIDIDLAAFWQDPYPDLARLRREAPIAFVPQLGSTLLCARDDIFVSEKQIDVFSSHQPQGLMNKLMGHNMMRKDGDAHHGRTQGDLSGDLAEDSEIALGRAISGPCGPHPRRAGWRRHGRFRAGLCAAVLGRMPEDDHRAHQHALSGHERVVAGHDRRHCKLYRRPRGGSALSCGDIRHRCRDRRHDAGAEQETGSQPARRDAAGRPADGKRARQHQACDLRRPERAARCDRRHGMGAADPSRSACAGAERQIPWLQVFEEYARWISPIGMSPRRIAKPWRSATSNSNRKSACF